MKKTLVLLVSLVVLSNLYGQYKAQNQKLDAMIMRGLEDWKIPGLAVVIVKDGQITFKKTYGVTDLESRKSVNDNTLFNMGSTTKAIIALAAGILVDQGKLRWEDKVRDYLPYFELSDPYITAEARVKDLFTHNLGIGSGDMLWAFDSLSTRETLEKFAAVPKAYPVRGGFLYNNLMYAVAGELIEAVSGQHWTEFVKEHIFEPLDMHRSYARSSQILQAGNYVSPYLDDVEEGVIKVDHNFSDQIGAAGMIWTGISDIGRYLQMLVNDGIYQGDTLVRPATFDYLFRPHALITQQMYPVQDLVKPHWQTYGLGWFQQDYRGQKMDFHTGSINGLVAIAGLMRDQDMAVYVYANMDHAELRHAIMYKAFDLYLFDDDGRDWHREVLELYSGRKARALKQLEAEKNKRVSGTEPSLPLDAYTGTYQHDIWGRAKVTVSDGNLRLMLNDFFERETVQHWHYDTFKLGKKPGDPALNLVSFSLNGAGRVKDLVLYNSFTFLKIE